MGYEQSLETETKTTRSVLRRVQKQYPGQGRLWKWNCCCFSNELGRETEVGAEFTLSSQQ